MLLWQPAEAGKRCTLGILDVYGFESLAHNGLERLLINYAAERVQVHTRTHTQPAEAGKRCTLGILDVYATHTQTGVTLTEAGWAVP